MMALLMDKILIINQSSGYLVYDLAERLSSKYQITLISGGIVTNKPFISKVISYFDYKRYSLFARFFSWTLFSFQCLVHLSLNPFRYKQIILYSNPPVLPFFLFPWSRRITYVFFDLYPNALMSFSNFKFFSVIYSLWINLSCPIFNKMIAIVFITDEMKSLFLDTYGKKLNSNLNFHVVPLWLDSNISSSLKNASDFSSSNVNSAVVSFFYSGNFGLTHPVEKIVNAFIALPTDFPGQLSLFGSGSRFTHVRNISSSVSSINMGGFLSHSDYVAYLNHSDIGIVCIDTVSGNVSLPSKLFAMLACGLPILAIAPHNSSLAKIVDKYQCGLVADPDVQFEISEAFIRLGEDGVLRDKFGRNSLLASSNFTKENAKVFLDFLSVNSL